MYYLTPKCDICSLGGKKKSLFKLTDFPVYSPIVYRLRHKVQEILMDITEKRLPGFDAYSK